MSNCNTSSADRRRVFWTTQPQACDGTVDRCGVQCSQPGLQLLEVQGGSTFATNDWLRSLCINILMTDGRKADTFCGFTPGAQGGHWSESFRDDNLPIGTIVRHTPTTVSISDSIAMVRAQIENDLGQLVVMNIARTIEVTTKYIGNAQVVVDVIMTPYGGGPSSKVGLIGQRNTNSWAWN